LKTLGLKGLDKRIFTRNLSVLNVVHSSEVVKQREAGDIIELRLSQGN
jgi:hypothetical protein